MAWSPGLARWLPRLAWLLPPAAPILALLPDLLAGRWLYARDTGAFVYVLRRWHWQRLIEDGSLPLWNDGLFSGLAHLSDPQLGLFAPTGLLLPLIDGYLAHELALLLLLAMGGLGMALWLKELTRDQATALALGACYPLSGVLLSNMAGSPFLAGACLFPWALWASRRFQERPGGPGRFALLVFCLAWPILEGDPIGVFWMSGPLMADALLGGFRGRLAKLAGVLAACILAAGLSAPSWLPAFDTLTTSLRASGVPYAEATWFSLTPAQLGQLLAPALWGRAAEGTFWGHALVASDLPYDPHLWHDSLYLGIPVLVLVGLGAWRVMRARREMAWLAFSLLYLVIALGDDGGLHPWLYAHLPLYAWLRFPAKFLTYANLLLFGLAGLGLSQLRARIAEGPGWLRGSLMATAALFGLSAALALGLYPGAGLPAGAAELLARNAWTAGALGLVAALLAVLAWLRADAPTGARRNQLLAAFLGIMVLDMLLWAPTGWSSPASELDRFSRVGALLAGAGPHKILRDGQLDRQPPGPKDRVGRRSLRHNWALLEGLSYTFGYAPTVPARFMQLHGKAVFQNLPVWARALGITHVLTPAQPAAPVLQALAAEGRLELVESFPEDNLAVLAVHPVGTLHELLDDCVAVEDGEKARDALVRLGPERRQAVLEPTELLWRGTRVSTADLQREGVTPPVCHPLAPGLAESNQGSPGEVEALERTTRGRSYAVRLSRPAWLLVRDTFHPGWRASWNDRELPLLRVDFLHMAVALPPGSGRLELKFDPPGPRWALRLALGSLALLAVLALLGLRRRRARGVRY
jgi:hypothetical protein